jgi:hypothetical protein
MNHEKHLILNIKKISNELNEGEWLVQWQLDCVGGMGVCLYVCVCMCGTGDWPRALHMIGHFLALKN